MKLNSFFKLFMFLGLGAIAFTSCEPESPIPGAGAPSITFAIGSGANVTVKPNETFTVKVNAAKGDSDLKTLAVYEEGALVPFDRLKINGTAAASNPILLFGADKSSLTYDIEIKAHATSGTKKYAVEVKDEVAAAKNVSLNVTTEAIPPVLIYNGPSNFGAGVSSLININVSATKGSGKITKISVLEDSVAIPADRVTFAGVVFDTNPYTIPAANQDGFTNESLVIRTAATPGTKVYKVVITDDAGSMSMQSFTVEVGGTVDVSFGKLFNQAGPTGTGGLDLDDALGTGSSSTLAEIRDQGNGTDGAWQQKISGVNASELKLIEKGKNGVSESFAFGEVMLKSEIQTLFGQGSAVTISSKLVGGEVFAVKRDNKYYLIEILSINIVTADNSDNYSVNIRK